jgi:molybdopterin molybdotransferase
MVKTLLDDCFRPSQQRLRHQDALALLAQRLTPISGVEDVPIDGAAGRILAETIHATTPVPAHTNSAVDGYAFAASDYDRSKGTTFQLAGRAAAGHPLDEAVAPGRACRILTGAVLPGGVDTVAMQEDCDIGSDSSIRVPAGLKTGANVRRAGEDVAAGAVLIESGSILTPQDLAALASVGRASVTCHRRLSVAIVSTGDEVRRPGTGVLLPGQVFDANAPMLAALARLAVADVSDLGIWPDNATSVRERLSEAARTFDVVLTSGGASRGDEDHMSAALAALGSRHFWQLAIKPGRPMMLGQIGSTPVVGLPGNPVAVFVCFLMYVRPMLLRLGGGPFAEPRRWPAVAEFGFKGRKTGRREFWRGRLVARADGRLGAEKYARDGSGLISGLRFAEGLIDIPEDAGDVAEGDVVQFIPFSEFGIQSPAEARPR